MYIPDNTDFAEMHMAEQDRQLAMLPICKECKERIQTEWLFEFDDGFICEKCMDEHKKSVDTLIY